MSIIFKGQQSVLKYIFFFFSFFFCTSANAQLGDSLTLSDSSAIPDSASFIETKKVQRLQEVLKENTLINVNTDPVAFPSRERMVTGRELDFYFLCGIFIFFGILRTLYGRYFTNMFRVFFNTSLRQSQLTDQLLQAKLSSLLFNIFFVMVAGFYVYQLLKVLGVISPENDLRLLIFIIAAITLMYCGKYLILKFSGWISGYSKEVETYTFIIFLVNKILAISLLPLIVIISFSQSFLVKVVIVLSYLVIIIMFFLRFFRSYGVLQSKIQVNRFHFLLYIAGIEVLPLFLIYKAAVTLLGNNS